MSIEQRNETFQSTEDRIITMYSKRECFSLISACAKLPARMWNRCVFSGRD